MKFRQYGRPPCSHARQLFYVALAEQEKCELVTGDDSPNTQQDGGCSVVIPADGKYIIQIRESAFGGNGACQYRLHVGTFPRPTAVVPAGGKPGEELEVTFLGDPSGPIKQKFEHGRRRILDLYTRLIQRGIDAGELRPLDARTAALAILGIASWTSWTSCISPSAL